MACREAHKIMRSTMMGVLQIGILWFMARQNLTKRRSIQVVYEHFESNYNAAIGRKMLICNTPMIALVKLSQPGTMFCVVCRPSITVLAGTIIMKRKQGGKLETVYFLGFTHYCT